MGLTVDSRILIIRNPYVFPRAGDPLEELQRLANTNKLVLLLQGGKQEYPVKEELFPPNVHLIKFSYYEGEENSLLKAKKKVADLLETVGAEIIFDAMPVLFSGAYIRLPDDVQVQVVKNQEDYEDSNIQKTALKVVGEAEWRLW